MLTRQAFACQLQEYFAIALQAVPRKLAEHTLELLARPGERLFALGAHGVVGLDARSQDFQLDAQRLLPFGAQQERHQ